MTDAHTSAAEALADGKGVCQDHAHIFIAAARTLAIPARYVTGYLVLDGGGAADAHHAWAEAWVEGWAGSASTSPTASAPPTATCASQSGSMPATRPRSSARAAAGKPKRSTYP